MDFDTEKTFSNDKRKDIPERRSVIFTPSVDKQSQPKLNHKLRAVNPHFPIFTNIKLSIPNRYWFDGAYRVYDPYNDEERFLRTINNFVRVCGIDKYFYIDDDYYIWEVNTKSDTKIPVSGMQIIDDEAEKVGHIMPVALGSVVNACPELKPIIDIGYVK